jgi:hypothetical protein
MLKIFNTINPLKMLDKFKYLESARKWSRPNLKCYPSICMEQLRKTMKGLNRDSLFVGQDLN